MIHAHDLSDRRWQALLDADAADEPLTPSERAHLREHRAREPGVRAEQAFYRQLAARAAAVDEPAGADDPLVAASLAAFFEAGPQAMSQEPSSAPAPASRRAWLAGAGLLLAAGLAAVWLLRPPPTAAPLAPLAAAPATPAPAPAVPAPVPEVMPPRPAVTLAARSGPLRSGAVDLAPGTRLAVGAALRAGDAEACLEGPDRSTLCLQPGSEAQVLAGGDVALTAGAARIAATGPTAIAVVVAGVRFTADDAAYSLAVQSDTWSADVERGSVALTDARGPLARLGPGDRLRRGPAAPPTGEIVPAAPDARDPTPAPEPGRTTRPYRASKPAADMLDEARGLRAAGEHAKAAKAYEALIAAHPDVPSATAALVALGQLYLGRLGDPTAALRSFDRYLQRAEAGALAEEAAVGRIEALRRLGRLAEERAAITLFLDRHPTSSYADGLRRRLNP